MKIMVCWLFNWLTRFQNFSSDKYFRRIHIILPCPPDLSIAGSGTRLILLRGTKRVQAPMDSLASSLPYLVSTSIKTTHLDHLPSINKFSKTKHLPSNWRALQHLSASLRYFGQRLDSSPSFFYLDLVAIYQLQKV